MYLYIDSRGRKGGGGENKYEGERAWDFNNVVQYTRALQCILMQRGRTTNGKIGPVDFSKDKNG